MPLNAELAEDTKARRGFPPRASATSALEGLCSQASNRPLLRVREAARARHVERQAARDRRRREARGLEHARIGQRLEELDQVGDLRVGEIDAHLAGAVA